MHLILCRCASCSITNTHEHTNARSLPGATANVLTAVHTSVWGLITHTRILHMAHTYTTAASVCAIVLRKTSLCVCVRARIVCVYVYYSHNSRAHAMCFVVGIFINATVRRPYIVRSKYTTFYTMRHRMYTCAAATPRRWYLHSQCVCVLWKSSAASSSSWHCLLYYSMGPGTRIYINPCVCVCICCTTPLSVKLPGESEQPG